MSTDDGLEIERLMRAFKSDNAGEVRRLLDQVPGLKERIDEPSGPFGSPAITGVKSVEMLDVLLDAGADIDAKNDWWAGGFGLLHVCSPNICRAAIEKGAKIDAHAASRLGMVDVLGKLLASDPAVVHKRGGDGQTPLHFACNVEIADLLLAHGADIDAPDVAMSTPAQYMVKSRQDVARFLVERGCKADILMASALGNRDLVNAILDGDPEAVRTRVEEPWFPLMSEENGGTIYQWELGWHVSAHQVARAFSHEEVFNLLTARSPIDVRLVACCWEGDETEVDRILQSDPDISERLSAGDQRQLAHAARNNATNAVRLMLKAGLPVAGRSQHNGTALHWAAWNGNLAMVQLLLAHRPPLDDRENDYRGSPLDWAIHASVNGWNPAAGDFAGIVKVFLEAGAAKPEKLAGSDRVRKVLEAGGVSG